MLKILENARIYTVNEEQPWADAAVIDGEKFVYVGSEDNEDFRSCLGQDIQRYDLQGKMVIPSFVDSHVHPAAIASCSWHVKLPLTYDLDELLGFISAYAREHPKEEKPFLYFEYYPSVLFGEDGPRKEVLDRVVSDRPCLVQDFGEHMAWVNSKMLEAMGVNRDTPAPMDDLAVFVRDEDGEPTGFVKEMAWRAYAENMYRTIGWKPPEQMTGALMEPVMKYFAGFGITAIADGFIEDESQLAVLSDMEKQGKLKFYYQGYVRCDSLAELPAKLAAAQRYQKKYGSKRIKIDTMKIFLDGTNESGNHYLVEPKSNDGTGTDCGNISMTKDDLIEYLIYCNARDFDVHVHLVGDGAFRQCCDAMEVVKARIGKAWHVQFTLAHCELIHPDDMLRPKELGITVNWTPRWSGGCYGEQAKLYLGEERWNRMYQFNPMIEQGVQVAFSSDVITWSKIDRMNPFYGMQIGHTRVDIEDPLDPDRFPGSVRPPESAKLSREILLKGSTLNGAKQMGWDHIMGSIEPGKLANLVVLSDNYFEVDPFEISKIKCEAVMFEGNLISGSLQEE